MCIKNCQSIRTGSFANRLKKSALGELGSTTGGLQTVLLKAVNLKPLRHNELRDWE